MFKMSAFSVDTASRQTTLLLVDGVVHNRHLSSSHHIEIRHIYYIIGNTFFK